MPRNWFWLARRVRADLIKRGKVRAPVEFGHKVFLAESAEGLITQSEVLKGNPPDEVHVASSLQRHRQDFGRAPELYGSDRGFFSEQNLASCQRAGVQLVCIPQQSQCRCRFLASAEPMSRLSTTGRRRSARVRHTLPSPKGEGLKHNCLSATGAPWFQTDGFKAGRSARLRARKCGALHRCKGFVGNKHWAPRGFLV
jgi:hypothetical protein